MESEKIFIRGFNAGYFWHNYEPDTLKQVLKQPNKEDLFVVGMQEGKRELEREKLRDELSRDRDKEIDIDIEF